MQPVLTRRLFPLGNSRKERMHETPSQRTYHAKGEPTNMRKLQLRSQWSTTMVCARQQLLLPTLARERGKARLVIRWLALNASNVWQTCAGGHRQCIYVDDLQQIQCNYRLQTMISFSQGSKVHRQPTFPNGQRCTLASQSISNIFPIQVHNE